MCESIAASTPAGNVLEGESKRPCVDHIGVYPTKTGIQVESVSKDGTRPQHIVAAKDAGDCALCTILSDYTE